MTQNKMKVYEYMSSHTWTRGACTWLLLQIVGFYPVTWTVISTIVRLWVIAQSVSALISTSTCDRAGVPGQPAAPSSVDYKAKCTRVTTRHSSNNAIRVNEDKARTHLSVVGAVVEGAVPIQRFTIPVFGPTKCWWLYCKSCVKNQVVSSFLRISNNSVIFVFSFTQTNPRLALQ